MSNRIVMEGINSKGFGFAPKMVMKDRRLSIESKAIYMYFSSYCGAGESAFPKLTTILYDLKISENRYYKYFNPLKELGYIEVKSRRTQKDNGQWVADSNIYILKQMINMNLTVNSNDSEITVNEKNNYSEHIENTKHFELLQNEGIQNEGIQNEGDNNNNSINNNSINNNSMIDDDNGRATEEKRRIDLYKEWCELKRVTPPVVKFIKEITMQISNELYELLLEKAINNASNNKNIYSYLKKSVMKCIEDNELTVEAYKVERNTSDKDFRRKSPIESKSSKKEYNKKTKFHNFEETFEQYSQDELDDIIEKSQRAKYQNI